MTRTAQHIVPQQTATRNGVTVTFPLGYESVEAYAKVLQYHLKTAQSNPKLQHHVATIERDLVQVTAYLK